METDQSAISIILPRHSVNYRENKYFLKVIKPSVTLQTHLVMLRFGKGVITAARGIKKIVYPYRARMDPDGGTAKGTDQNLYADRYVTRFHPDSATTVTMAY